MNEITAIKQQGTMMLVFLSEDSFQSTILLYLAYLLCFWVNDCSCFSSRRKCLKWDISKDLRLSALTAINVAWNKQSINVWTLQHLSHGVQATGSFSRPSFALLETETFFSHVKHQTFHPTDIRSWQTSQSWSLQLWHHKTSAIQAWSILNHQSCNQSMNSFFLQKPHTPLMLV